MFFLLGVFLLLLFFFRRQLVYLWIMFAGKEDKMRSLSNLHDDSFFSVARKVIPSCLPC